MFGNSRSVTSNQDGVHEKLDGIVAKYRQHENRRPISDHTQQAFDDIVEWLGDWQGPVVLDSCCGVGESTAYLANKYPDARVIGIDKSELRVNKHHGYQGQRDNYRVFRADVNDLWRLVGDTQWDIVKHYLLYPNPYPKATQVQKRWHASTAMPALMSICTTIEVRSNWLTYLLEFAQAAQHYGLSSDLVQITTAPITPFERKYLASEQHCWQLLCSADEQV